jgi:hypothetical protein
MTVVALFTESLVRPVILALTLVAFTIGFGSSLSRGDDDWWSLLKDVKPFACQTPSREKPNGANFVIAGVNLRDGQPIDDAEKKIAKPWAISSRGDAGSSRDQICFKSASERGRFKLIFEQGEIASVAYLIDGGPDWTDSYKCVVSQKVSEKLATASGLHLGMTAAEVEKILGKPCAESNDSVEYFFDYQYLLPLDERQRLKGKGDLSADEPVDWFSNMQIKFRGAKACYIAISTGETQ